MKMFILIVIIFFTKYNSVYSITKFSYENDKNKIKKQKIENIKLIKKKVNNSIYLGFDMCNMIEGIRNEYLKLIRNRKEHYIISDSYNYENLIKKLLEVEEQFSSNTKNIIYLVKNKETFYKTDKNVTKNIQDDL